MRHRNPTSVTHPSLHLSHSSEPPPHSPLQSRSKGHTGEFEFVVDDSDLREQLRACVAILSQVRPVRVLNR